MSWYNSSWKYRVKITVDHSKVGSDLTDFPVYVDLSTLPSGFHTNVKSDGGDIRVTRSDGTTECPREVVFYDSTNDKGELHFKANSLSSTTDTVFYIYYGNSSASDYATDATYGAENVWNDFLGVLHCNESSSPLMDSSGNGLDATQNGAPTYGVTAGMIGNGVHGDGVDDGFTMDKSGWDSTDKITIEGIVYTSSDWAQYGGGGLFSAWDGGPDWLVWWNSSGTISWRVYTVNNTGGVTVTTSSKPSAGESHHVCAVYDGAKIYLYVDGVLTGPAKATGNLLEKTANYRLFYYSSKYIDANYDEIRTHKVARGSSWVSATKDNLLSPTTFYTVGTQEANSTEANSVRSLYIFGKNTDNSNRGLYTYGSLNSNSTRGLYLQSGEGANSTRDLYVEVVGTGNSVRGLYLLGSQVLSTDYFNVVFSEPSISDFSERSLYLQGSLSSNSERGLLLEGKPVIDERGLYLLGYIRTSSTRDLYLGGIDTGTSERNLYTQGTSSSTSNRSFYIQGSISTNNERGLYLIGKSLEGERELYLHGFETGSSEKKLYLEGANVGYDNRGLYIQGYLSDSSSRGLYLYGYGVGTPERALHIAGVGLGASERGVCVEGKDIDVSERGLYIQGSLEDGSNRKLYLEGYISANIERTLYIQGQETLSSSMPLYIWGYEVGSFERNLYIQGYDIKSLSRGLYIQGYLSDNSDRELYLFGYDIETSERGLYLVGLDLGTSERSIYLESKDMGASERDLYVHGFVRSFSNRGLYIVGDGEVPFHEGNVIIKIDEGLYLNPKTGRIYVAIE